MKHSCVIDRAESVTWVEPKKIEGKRAKKVLIISCPHVVGPLHSRAGELRSRAPVFPTAATARHLHSKTLPSLVLTCSYHFASEPSSR